MGRRLAVLLACAVACAGSSSAQTPAAPPAPDGIELLLARLESLLQRGTGADFPSIVSTTFPQEQVEAFASGLFDPAVRRAVVLERDRAQLTGTLPGDGYRVVAEVFLETARRARIVTVLFDVRRPSGGPPDSWRISAAEAATSIDGLFRLRVDPSRQLTARNLTIAAEDLLLTLSDGSAFLVESESGTTGLVLFGTGVMRFAPGPDTERGQMRIFAGTDSLTAPFEAAFIRLSPADYEARVSAGSLAPAAAVNPRDLRRAQELFTRDAPKSFSLDLREMSSDIWYLLPSPGDFLAEVRTRRHGTLTYSRMGMQSEDITLIDRERRRTIALYPSAQRRAVRGLAFNEDEQRDYDVVDYDIEANIQPQSEFLEGRTRLRLRMRTGGSSSLTLRLANDLVVRGVVSPEYGRLLHVRVREQNTVIVNFPVQLPRDTDITLLVSYAGRMTSQDIEDESLQAGEARQEEPLVIPAEPNFLLSSRSFWYPQNPIPDYATATLRITIPEGLGCVASGERRTGDEVTLRDLLTIADGPAHVFTARDPLRYFAVVVSRFVRAAETTVRLAPGQGDPTGGAGIGVTIHANPRQQGRGKALIDDVEAIMRFYAGLVGEAPYGSMDVALVESELPGGHSPGYFAVLNTPLPTSRLTWRNDPASFSSFPEFFLAHEIAHQWWGQAVGWRNYHEQWLSEGLAQYFAALYAQHTRGERTFIDMLRQFRRWAVAESDQGPISLGSRVGHLRGEPRVFRAVVYNKSAAVLHMLRRLIGDEHFFNGLRRFYAEQKFRKAGTDDLRAAFEEVAGRSLERYFDRWIYGAELPRLRYSSAFGGGKVSVRFEQLGGTLFDLPVTVTVLYADGTTQQEVVPVTDRHVEWSVATDRPVKQVQINRDYAAIAVFERAP